jgi:alkylated DNA nucleotide flippase Atl1
MNRAQRAMQIWQVLIAAAHNRQVLTYGMVGEFIGLGAGFLAQTLGLIMRFCAQNDLPPLTILVVNQDTGQPGHGLTTIEELNRDRERVFNFAWYSHTPVQVMDFAAIQAQDPELADG